MNAFINKEGSLYPYLSLPMTNILSINNWLAGKCSQLVTVSIILETYDSLGTSLINCK